MTETDLPSVAPRYSHWPKTALRVGFGVIWLIDAVLKWLPGFRHNYMDTIMGQADGQPGWTKPWLLTTDRQSSPAAIGTRRPPCLPS